MAGVSAAQEKLAVRCVHHALDFTDLPSQAASGYSNFLLDAQIVTTFLLYFSICSITCKQPAVHNNLLS